MNRFLFLSTGLIAWTVIITGLVIPAGAMATSLVDAQAWDTAWPFEPGDREALYWTTVLGISGAVAALLLALPVAACVALQPRISALIWAGILLPLLIPPYIYGYAWELVIARSGEASGLLTSGPVRAGWTLASWLWPIPAMLLIIGWRHAGGAVMQLGILDASPVRAFIRAVLPALRPYVTASLAVVFFLAVADASVADLAMTPQGGTYARVVLARAQVGVPLGVLLVKSWPLLALLLAAGLVLIIEGRTVVRHEASMERTTIAQSAAFTGRHRTMAGLVLLVVLGLTVGLPIATLAASIQHPQTWWSSLQSLLPQWRHSLVVSGVAGCLAGILGAWLGLRGKARRLPTTFVGASIAGLVIFGVLPAAVTGHATVGAYNQMDMLHRLSQVLTGRAFAYEPVVWVLGLVARFGFLTVLIARYADRSSSTQLTEQAQMDGADPSAIWRYVWLARAWPSLVVGGVATAGFVLGEVVLSTLLAPPGPWSIGTALLNKMHFGRYDDVVVSTLLLLGPALIVACVLAVGTVVANRTHERSADALE